MYDAAEQWQETLSNQHLSGEGKRAYKRLGRKLKEVDNFDDEGDTNWKHRSNTAYSIFCRLAKVLTNVYGEKHIALIDEYDTPLLRANGKEWRKTAEGVYKTLLGGTSSGFNAAKRTPLADRLWEPLAGPRVVRAEAIKKAKRTLPRGMSLEDRERHILQRALLAILDRKASMDAAN
ncbi:hypothetical protein GGI12_005484 [Dipsacomyces acuminosporus]|nr:hypothetical protein GGI12_005484 [Dipsacomyces acuminosporus]